MRLNKECNIKHLEKEWNSLFTNLENKLTPFQSYSANLDLYNAWYYKPSRWCLKTVYVTVWKCEKCVGIIPCCEGKNKVYDFCSQSPVDYYDWLLSPELSNSEIESIFQGLKSLFPNKSFSFRRIRKSSPLYDFFSKKSDVVFEEDEICGSGLDCSNYENWYNSLSKHMRQNLRTAYNKIQKEKKEIKLHVYNNENWKENIYYKDCIKFYEERCFTKNKQRFSKIRDFLRHKYNPLETTLQKHNQRVMFILSIDNNPAAFFAGFIANQTIIIPRLSMNEQYAKYDTVTLLISEAIKYLNNKSPHCHIIQMDFTRGGEPYKFKLGAQETYVYRVSF